MLIHLDIHPQCHLHHHNSDTALLYTRHRLATHRSLLNQFLNVLFLQRNISNLNQNVLSILSNNLNNTHLFKLLLLIRDLLLLMLTGVLYHTCLQYSNCLLHCRHQHQNLHANPHLLTPPHRSKIQPLMLPANHLLTFLPLSQM